VYKDWTTIARALCIFFSITHSKEIYCALKVDGKWMFPNINIANALEMKVGLEELTEEYCNGQHSKCT
jgi:hypothetical protein